ncbi:hypothetical protein QBC34DRAFT_440034 [Podospora aff. communis PSN243]|uniref:BZIP domain-containing protein n=1 Tax=Podospora aff. communis PSN243 TaxID=3040156 RepID=A0AAV9GH85_9PEZI|nr:hypothetical protein QBC34DRAFT_440034 [Podospora aff. communis PSN243]
MAPAANTAKTRAAAQDSDSDGYQGRLEEAEAARIRLRKAREDRDNKRKALAAAYRRSLFTIQDRVQKSVTKYQDLHTAMHMSQLERLNKAVNTRDGILEEISNKLSDLQQLMLNHGTQLSALYEGRREDIASLLEQPATQTKDDAR